MHKGSLIHILNGHRALVMAAVLFCLLSLFAPNFLSVRNVTTILKGASLNAVVAIGFTLILILGQLDLSIGAVVMLCGMLAVGLQPQLGWAGSILVSLAAGGMVGLVNGLLVVKARVNSFIVTLGTMTIVMGLTHLYSEGGSRAIDDFRLADWLDRPVLPLLPPMTLITLLLVTVFTVFLAKTRPGRNFFLVGGNPEAAWLAGLNRDRYLMAGFILCGFTAAAGGALFAASQSSMTSSAVLGTRTLMTVLAAVIIGGTLMTGGKGSVLNSYFAVLLLNTLFNGIGCFGRGDPGADPRLPVAERGLGGRFQDSRDRPGLAGGIRHPWRRLVALLARCHRSVRYGRPHGPHVYRSRVRGCPVYAHGGLLLRFE